MVPDSNRETGRPEPSKDAAANWNRNVAAVAGLIVVLLIGLGLRVHLAGTPGYPSDLHWFYAWADAAHRGGLEAAYKLPGNLACNYPPGYPLLLSQIPALYEFVTGEPFRRPPDPQTKRQDEAIQALRLHMQRRGVVKMRELVEHYRRHDPQRYRAIREARLNPELVMLGLISREQYQKLQTLSQQDPQAYHAFRQNLAPRIEKMLTQELPYPVPDRLRQLAVWIKFPAILFDLAGAVVLFVVLRGRRGALGALAVAAIYLFLPAVVYDSTYWGQVDSVHSLLMLLCLVLLIRGRMLLLGLVYAVAILTKFQSIMILPVLAAGSIRYWRDMLKDGGVGTQVDRNLQVLRSVGMVLLGLGVGAAIILIPAAAQGAADEALATYGKASGQYHWVSVCAFNPWWLLNPMPGVPKWYYRFAPQDHQPFLGPITPKHVGLLLLAAFSLWIVWLIWRRGCRYETIAPAGAAMVMGFFCLPTEIHERYGFPAMILAAYVVGMGWRHLPVFVLLGFSQFYNFTAVQPVEDPRYAWLAPMANAFQGQAWFTYVLVLIHVGSLVYFTMVVSRQPAAEGSPVSSASGRAKESPLPAGAKAGRKKRRERT